MSRWFLNTYLFLGWWFLNTYLFLGWAKGDSIRPTILRVRCYFLLILLWCFHFIIAIVPTITTLKLAPRLAFSSHHPVKSEQTTLHEKEVVCKSIRQQNFINLSIVSAIVQWQWFLVHSGLIHWAPEFAILQLYS